VQAVPTTVTRGPDGALYVGQLTGFPFPVGGARVYRVVPGQSPTIFADGFTNIIDMAFARDGTLYVLEITGNGLQSGDPTGALMKVGRDGSKSTILKQPLMMPGGIALGPDGAIYVTNKSTFAGTGEVLRIRP
jgi:sugar lactone lactonase YvrE